MTSYTHYGVPMGQEADWVSDELAELADLYHRLASLGRLARSLPADSQDLTRVIQLLELELARRDLLEGRVLTWVSLLGLAPLLLSWLRDELALELDQVDLPAADTDLLQQVNSYSQQLQTRGQEAHPLLAEAIGRSYRRLRHHLLVPYQ